MKKSRISRTKTSGLYKRLAIIFTTLVVILLALIIYFSVGKTVITITLEPQDIMVSFTQNIGPLVEEEQDDNRPKIKTSKIEGYSISAEISGTEEFPITGEGNTVAAPSIGTVTIYNNWSEVQPLTATTRLLTPNGLLFRIKERVDVPAGGKVENVDVYADEEGTAGDIEPTTFTIPGLWAGLQDKIYAESFQAMTGGERTINTLTQSDVTEARRSMINKLAIEARSEIEKNEKLVANQDVLPEQTLSPTALYVITNPALGEEAGSFDLTMTIRYVGVVLNEKELLEQAISQLESSLPNDEKIHTYNEDDLKFSMMDYDLEAGTALVQVTMPAKSTPLLANPIFNKKNIAGKSRSEIQSYLTKYDAISSVDIKFSPFWVSQAPNLVDHINIAIK